MLISGAIGSLGVKILVASKDIYATMLLIILFKKNIKRIRLYAVDIAVISFLLVHIYYFWSTVSLFPRILSFREGFMIIGYYSIGRLLLINKIQLMWMLKIIVVFALFVAIFGHIERFIFSEEIWNYLGALKYEINKKGWVHIGMHSNLIPNNWFTYVGDETPRRMVATIADAPSLSRYLAFPILILIYFGKVLFPLRIKKPQMILIGIILTSSIVLSMGRGGQLICMLGIVIFFIHKKSILSLIAILPGLLLLSQLNIFNIGSAVAIRHFTGFMQGYNSLITQPLGHGLGTSGGKAVYFAPEEVKEEVVESYFGALAYQLGLPGIIAYFSLFLFMIVRLFTLYKRYKNKINKIEIYKIPLLGISLGIGIFITSMLAQAAISPISAGLALIFCGFAIGYEDQKELKRKIII